ncbi:MAG: DMT family transporter, partial [Pseudorhodobacter sp.]|nr:DMT family transporter [Pseudorhodobacter sp.]
MPQTHRPLAAALWMIGSILAFSAMAVAGREASHLHDTFEIMLWRSLVGLSVVLALGLATGRLREIRRNRLGQHFARNLVHFTGQNLWFWALTVIPLAQVFALEFTSPIWVILLSPLFLGERITPARALAAALGFAGILI